MLIRPQIGFTYDCEDCRQPVSGCVELFALSGRSFVHHCSCGHGRMTMRAVHGRQIYIDYPCVICGRHHQGTFSAADALAEPVVLPCIETGLPACFIGSPERIEYMDSADTEEEMAELIHELLTSPVDGDRFMVQAAVELIEQLRREGKLGCECGSCGFSVDFDGSLMTVECSDCGRREEIQISCWDDIAELSRRDGILLKNRQ